MASRYIDGNYPGGYTISNHVAKLTAGPAAQVSGGAYGLATEADRTTAVKIDNAGSIYGTTAGIMLVAGGAISNTGSITAFAAYKGESIYGGGGVEIVGNGTLTNGNKADTSAVIGGYFGLSISGTGSVVNFGTIYSKTFDSGCAVSVTLGDGNLANYGSILAGVDIGSGTPRSTLENNGYIGASFSRYDGDPYYSFSSGFGVAIGNGGVVKNGLRVHSAVIAGGVDAFAGSTIINDGTIAGGRSVNDADGGFFPVNEFGSGPSVILNGAGIVLNGQGGVASASLSGSVEVYEGSGTIENFGVIGATGGGSDASGQGDYGSASRYVDQSVRLNAGGTVINGSASDMSGWLADGVLVRGAAGLIENFGAIGSGYQLNSQFYYEKVTLVSTIRPSVELDAGGTVINGSVRDSSAQIQDGITISGGLASIGNFGSIGHRSQTTTDYNNNLKTSISTIPYASIGLGAGGTVVNGSTADQTAEIAAGIAVAGGPGSITNFGTIGYCVRTITTVTDKGSIVKSVLFESIGLQSGGAVLNGSSADTGARIDGGSVGVQIGGGAGRVTNFGTISTQAGTSKFEAGIVLTGGGSIGNGSTASTVASITGYDAGIYITGGTGTVTNFGHIGETSTTGAAQAVGVQAGIDLKSGGAVTNGATGNSAASISGVIGIDLYGAGTVTNFATISGTQSAIVFHDASDRLIEDASGILTGAVAGGGGSLILEGATGTLTGLGSTISGFKSIDVAAGGAWVLAGNGTVASGTVFRNDGRVAVAQSDTLALDSGIAGSGNLAIRSGATAAIKGVVAATGTVTFTGGDAELALVTPAHFLGAISNLGGGGTDKLVLDGFGKGTTFTFAPNGASSGGILTVTDGAREAQITLLGQLAAAGFHAAVGASYTVFTYTAPSGTTLHLASPR